MTDGILIAIAALFLLTLAFWPLPTGLYGDFLRQRGIPQGPEPITLFTQGEDPVTLKTFTIQVEETATAAFETAMAALKSAGHIVEAFVVTETQKLVAETKALPVGTLAMNIISALETHASTGEEKMAALIGAVTPALSALKAAGGLKGLETSVENFAKEFAQSAFNDFRAAAAGMLHLDAAAPALAA